MKHMDYPLLFRVADNGAISAQKLYLWLVKLEFLFLILAAIFSSIEVNHHIIKKTLPIITGISLLIVLISRILKELGGA